MAPTEKQIVIELKVTMLKSVPSDWTQEEIEFWLNESSHCLGNEIQDLAASDSAVEGSCDTCGRAEAHYLREATAEDLVDLKLRTADGQVIDIQPERKQIAEPGGPAAV